MNDKKMNDKNERNFGVQPLQKKYEEKKIRRTIVIQFMEQVNVWKTPLNCLIYKYLQLYRFHLPIVREALAKYKYSNDRWSESIWKILEKSDEEISVEILHFQKTFPFNKVNQLEEFLMKIKDKPVNLYLKNIDINAEDVSIALTSIGFPLANINFRNNLFKTGNQLLNIILPTTEELNIEVTINFQLKEKVNIVLQNDIKNIMSENSIDLNKVVTKTRHIDSITKRSFKFTDNSNNEKLNILSLPPLVAADLLEGSADLNVLQHLFNADHLLHLKGRRLEEFSDSDIILLSSGINNEIKKLKFDRNVGFRPLAHILLSVARLQFDRLEMGTSSVSIRYCLGTYSMRMAQYLIQQHNRYDAAQDYIIEAIYLNWQTNQGINFQTALLFKVFFESKNTIKFKSPKDCLVALNERVNDPEIITRAARGFIELATYIPSWAEKWFSLCSNSVQIAILNQINSSLLIDDDLDFNQCITIYREVKNKLEIILKQVKNITTLHIIGQAGMELSEWSDKYSSLLTATNEELINLLINTCQCVNRAMDHEEYDSIKNSLKEGLNLLERAISYKNDNRTSFWASHVNEIVFQWSEIINSELKDIALANTPILKVNLTKNHVYLTNEKFAPQKPRISFEVINLGKGIADRLNIWFEDKESNIYRPKTIVDYKLMPNTKIEDYFEIDEMIATSGLQLIFESTYYDPERRLTEFSFSNFDSIEFKVEALSSNISETLNPFQTSREVEDEKMFVGRNKILDEIMEDLLFSKMGGLLMLHGQRRVGKSSLLLFLERRLEKVVVNKGIIPVKISWLNYSAHSAPLVLQEIAKIIKKNCFELFGKTIKIPERSEFRESYSVAFNDVIEETEALGIKRVVIIIDEFDVVVNQLDEIEMKFDRRFFEYLRGLSKRQNISLVVTGGEMMPMLFERWGEVFNHDRNWRITYLSANDESVDLLVKNPYVKEYLEFSESSINQIKHISACNPFFIQMLCYFIVLFSQQQKTTKITGLDVQEAAQWLVQNELDVKHVRHLYSPFTDKVDNLDLVVIGIVAEFNLNNNSLTHESYVSEEKIVSSINVANSEVISKIGELVRREILDRHVNKRELVTIKLPIFGRWFYNNKPEYSKWANLIGGPHENS